MARNLQSKNAAQGVNPLLQALRLEDPLARQKEIAGILKECDEDKVASLLFGALLKSPDGESRKRIVEELVKIGSAKAVEVLEIIMSGDFDPEVQREAIEALKHLDPDKAVDALLSALRSGTIHGRWEAARALGDFNSDRVVDALIEASKDSIAADPAVSSLIQIGSDRAIDGLITVMQDMIHGTGMTSYNAMEGLMRLGTEKTIDGLFHAWNDTNSVQRSMLFGLLHQFKPKHLITPLCQRLQNRNLSSDDRETAAEMLGIIGTENEIPLLKWIWRIDTDNTVSWSALRAAEQIALSELEKKTERERALEETRAFIAHEFRHALTPLNAYVKLLDEALTQPEIDKEKLSSLTLRIHKQTDAAFALVNQYMDYSRPLSPQFKQTDINNLLQQSLDEFRAEFERRNIILNYHFAENASAEVDEQLLSQVLRNVITNAIQAIEKDGSLSITTLFDESNVAVTIRDTGIGIKPEYLPHIFEIGFTTKSGVRGAGFGLALSKRMIEEAHNGSITIANNTDGPGASVTLTLPIKQTEMKNGRQHLTFADR